MAQIDADRNLLFGFLALQMDFVSREALLAALGAWVSDKSRDLGGIFLAQGVLSVERHALLEALVREHLKAHGDDPRRSLAALSSVGPVRQDVEQIADPDFHASLAHLAVSDPGSLDPHATRAPSQSPTIPSGVRFRILRFHAKGGLGQVSVARDEELGREVALKEIQEKHADHLESRSRFVREAEVTGALEHPGIVPVYGLGHYADGRPYYAMRFIRGDSLKDAIARFHRPGDSPRDPTERAIQLRQMLGRFVDVCDAMEYAHSRGVLHRDLKPDNIMLGKFGETLVVDWGLAKTSGTPDESAIGEAPPIRPASGSGSAETLPGSAMGTPAYMSPEQAAGRLDLLGPASDVYSLGATLYHLLTGHPPIEDRDLGIVLRKVQEGDIPPPRHLNPEVPPALEAITRKAMALEPLNRYKSPRALANDIEHWLADEPIAALPEGWSQKLARWARRHRTWAQAGAATLVAITLVAVAASLFVNESRKLAEARRKAAVISQNDADDQRKEANKQRDEAIKQKKLADTQSIHARCQTARRFVDRGQTLCLQGNVDDGLLWLARGLKETPDEKEAPNNSELATLQWLARMQINAWAAPRHALKGVYWHSDTVHKVGFSPDGKIVITGCGSWTRQWDAATGRLIGDPIKGELSPNGKVALCQAVEDMYFKDTATGELIGERINHYRIVPDVAFSPDSKTVIAIKTDVAQLWDAATGQPIGELMEHQKEILAVAFSPDSKVVLIGSEDGTARLWDAATGQSIGKPMNHYDSVLAVSFSPNGKAVFTGSKDNTGQLWDAATGQPIGKPIEHKDSVDKVAFSPDGKVVLTISGFTVRLWDAATGEAIGKPMGYSNFIHVVAFSPDGKTILIGCKDKTASLRDTVTGKIIGKLMRHQDSVYAVAFSPDGKSLLTGSGDGTARLWDAATGKPIYEETKYQDTLWSFWTFSPDGKVVLSGRNEDKVRLWDAATGRPIGEPMKHQDRVVAVAFSPNSKVVLTGSEDNTARLWDAATGRPIGEPMKHQNSVHTVAFSPNGKTVLTAAWKTTQLWDAATGQPIGGPMTHQKEVSTVAFSPDGKTMHIGGVDGMSQLWDAETGHPIGEPMKHQDRVVAVAFSPNSKVVLTGSEDNTARLWDAATGRPIGEPMKHQNSVITVSFNHNGKVVLTKSGSTARLWDAATGQPIGEPMIHQERIVDATFSPDGKSVLTGGEDRMALLWDAATGRHIGETMFHKYRILAVKFSPDGKSIISADDASTTFVWPMPVPVEGNAERIVVWVSDWTWKMLGDEGLIIEWLDPEDWSNNHQRLEKLGGPPDDFAANPRREIARQYRQAEEYERNQEWFAAAWHLGRLIASEPVNGSLYRRRSIAHAKLGRWKETVTDYRKAIELEKPTSLIWNNLGDAYAELGSWDEADASYRKAIDADANDDSGWLNRARLRLVVGDREGYRKTCVNMLEHFRSTEDLPTAHHLAWTCSLIQGAVEEPNALVRLAEKDVQKNRFHHCFYTLGAALYRSGQFEEAVKRLSEAIEIEGNKGNVWNRLFLAMAQHRSGHPEEARNSLARAVELIDQLALEPPGQASALSRLPWHERMTLPILRHEAEWLILESGFPADPFLRP